MSTLLVVLVKFELYTIAGTSGYSLIYENVKTFADVVVVSDPL